MTEIWILTPGFWIMVFNFVSGAVVLGAILGGLYALVFYFITKIY